MLMQRSTYKLLRVMSLFGGVQCIGIVCSLIRAKLIAIWIGPVGVGLFGIYNSAVELVASSTQLNFRQSAVREVSQASDAQLPRMAAAVRWWARRLGVFGSLVMLIFSPLLSLASFGDFGHWGAFACLSAALLAMSVTSGEQTIQQGAGLLRLLSQRTVIGILAGVLVSVPLFYFMREGSIIPAILAYALLGMAAFVAWPQVKSARLPRSESIALGKGFLRLGMYMTLASLVTTGASYCFLSYLNNIADTYTTGIYQAGYTLIVKYVGLVFTALAMEYYPRISRLSMRPHATSLAVSHECTVLLWVVTPMVLVMVFGAPLITRLLYDDSFLPAVPMITVGICGALFRAISYCLAFVIIARGEGKTFVLTDVSSSLIGLGLNILGYRLWGFVGLGVSYVLWYIVYTLMVYAVYRYRYHMHLTRRCIATILITAAITAIALVISYEL